MIIPDFNLYRQEKKQWKEAGEPVRSDERVKELYNICASCEHYIPLPVLENRGQCAVCTCLLSVDDDRLNKLRWATTRCPLEEPKWTEDVENKEALKITQAPPKTGGCGCN
jgi:hypothetical protein